MRQLFAVLVLLAIGIAVLGFYRGWFSVEWEKRDNQGQVTGTINEDKIEADKKQAREKLEGLRGSKANAGSATEK